MKGARHCSKRPQNPRTYIVRIILYYQVVWKIARGCWRLLMQSESIVAISGGFVFSVCLCLMNGGIQELFLLSNAGIFDQTCFVDVTWFIVPIYSCHDALFAVF